VNADQSSMDPRLPDFDPTIIERFAERLYEKAHAFVVGSVVAGAALGVAFGAVPLTSLGESWPIPSSFGFATMLVGAVAGAILGYRIGDARSFAYMLQAQTALCQLQIERNTAAAFAGVAGQPEVAPVHVPQAPLPVAAAPVAPQPEPQPQPVQPQLQPEPEPVLRPVVVPPDASLTGYASGLRIAAPIND
jgi:hypothetical protein